MIALLTVILWWTFLLWSRKSYFRWFLLCITVCCATFTGWDYYLHWYPTGRLLHDTLLHAGPDATYACADALKKGDEVVIYASYNGWCKIKQVAVKTGSTGDGWKMECTAMRGWVPSDVIQRTVR